jgi:hypothetical protein
MPGSLNTAASELAKYNFHLVAVQEVSWDEVCSQPADACTVLCGSGSANHRLERVFLYMPESY